MNNIKISVIVPIYNMAKYVKECIDSIINQSLQEIEIICIDDCSTDETASIIKEYSIKDSRVKYYCLETNSGSGVARNHGINIASGEFLIFMDPDDLYAKNSVLEKLYSKAKENNVKICGGNLLAFENDDVSNILPNIWKENQFREEGLYSYKDYHYPSGYIRFIFDTQLIKDNNVTFPDLRRRQDPVFFIKAMALVDKFYATVDTIYLYRLNHKETIWSEDNLISVLNSFEASFELYTKNELWDHYARDYKDLSNYFPEIKILDNSNVNNKINTILQQIPYDKLRKSIHKSKKEYRSISKVKTAAKITVKNKFLREVQRIIRKLSLFSILV